MKIIKNISLFSYFMIVLVSCGTTHLEVADKKIYPNTSINSFFPEASRYVEEISPYKKQIDSIMSQVISYANIDFTKEGYSSTEGNLLADFILDFSRKYAREGKMEEPQICLINIGGVRNIIPKGKVTVGTVFEVAPFENALVFVELNGTQMNEMFDYLGKEKKGHPLAGIKIVYQQNQLKSVEIQEKPFDPKKTYWVATIDYLLNGGDGMDFFEKSKNVVIPDVKLRDLLLEQIKQYKILPENKEERLIFKN